MSKTITQEITVKLPPAETYQLLSEPKQIARWFSDSAEHRDGDKIYFEWQGENGTNGFEAEIIAAVPGETYSYRSVEENPSVTTFTLRKIDAGTNVLMVESDVAEQSYDEHVGGWQWFLSRLQGIESL